MSEASKTSVKADDLVGRLHDHALFNKEERCAMFKEAANEITRLTAELEIARKALEDIAFGTRVPEHKKDDTAFLRAGCCIAHQFATAALQGQQK